MSSIIPSGRYKGRAIEELSKAEHHYIWAAWNGSPRLKASEFFKKIVADFDRRKGVPSKDHETFADEPEKPVFGGRVQRSLDFDAPVQSLPFGKHKGVPIGDVPRDYLVWCTENLTSSGVWLMVTAELERRGVCSPKPSKPVAPPVVKKKVNDDAATHYSWRDSSGFEHRIPNDVSMAGRECEVCPF